MGPTSLWRAARRAGYDIGRDQVARLMKALEIAGVRRGRRVRTTVADKTAQRHPDLVNRDFTATAPNQLWVMDLTYVATWAQMAYVWFITDAFSRHIVGWRVASHMRTAMVLDALEMARWARGTRLEGLVTHSDTGSQFTSLRYGDDSPNSVLSRRSETRPGTMANHRRRRARHLGMGALVQHRTTPRLSR